MSDFLLQWWKTKNYSQDSPSFQIPREPPSFPIPFFSFIPLPVQNKYKMSDAII